MIVAIVLGPTRISTIMGDETVAPVITRNGRKRRATEMLKAMMNFIHRIPGEEPLKDLHREHIEATRALLNVLEIGSPPNGFKRPQDFKQDGLSTFRHPLDLL